MSKKLEKAKKRHSIKKRKTLHAARKKKQLVKRHKKESAKRAVKQSINNLIGQSQQKAKPTFDKSAWQTLEQSNNMSHGSVRSAVLDQKQSTTFNTAAWTPPNG